MRDAIRAKSDDFKLLPSRRKRSDGTDGGDDTELVDVNVKFTRSINTGSTDDNPDKTSGVEELINLVGEGKIYDLDLLHSILKRLFCTTFGTTLNTTLNLYLLHLNDASGYSRFS